MNTVRKNGPAGNNGWDDLRASLARLNDAILRQELVRLQQYRAMGVLTSLGKTWLVELRGHLARRDKGGAVT
jgi:hypothetical protein